MTNEPFVDPRVAAEQRAEQQAAQPQEPERAGNEQLSEEDAIAQLAELMAHLPDAPNVAQLAQWKQQFGELLVLPFSEDLFVVYRRLSRAEYRQIIRIPDELRRANPNVTDEELQDYIEDEMCRVAVLYPYNISEIIETAGGLAKTISEQIQLASYLLPVDLASSLVVKI